MGAQRQPVNDPTRVVGWLAVLWTVFLLTGVLLAGTGIDLRVVLGLWPRDPRGLLGVLTAPLVHANLQHLIGNSLALLPLGWIACRYSRKLTMAAVVYAMLGSGLLAWTMGVPGLPHIGASGVVFGLIGFLILNGLVRGGCWPLAITLLVGFLFGGAVATVLQTTTSDGQLLSWQMHLGGLIGGSLAAWQLRRQRPA
jgi:membrane associated rhomboid family serine protease